MRPVLYRVAAARDLEQTFQWYEAQRPGLGADFLAAVAASSDLVSSHPLGHPVIHRDVRRALLARFPYGLFYRIIDEVVVVVACFHAKRSPSAWRSRR